MKLIAGFLFSISPIKKPYGFNGSIWSQTILSIAIRGIARKIPGIPHIILPTTNAMMVNKGFIFTCDPTINGSNTHP